MHGGAKAGIMQQQRLADHLLTTNY